MGGPLPLVTRVSNCFDPLWCVPRVYAADGRQRRRLSATTASLARPTRGSMEKQDQSVARVLKVCQIRPEGSQFTVSLDETVSR